MPVDIIELERCLAESTKRLNELSESLNTLTLNDISKPTKEVMQECAMLRQCSDLIGSAMEMANTVRDRFERRLNLFKNDSNLAVSIPGEILSDIFERALLSTKPTHIELSEERAFVRTLVSVCHKWRRTALGTPALWSGIWCSRHGLMCADDCVREMESRLRQSGEVPLFVSLNLIHYRELDNTLTTPGLSLLVPHLRHLGTLIIELRLDDFPLVELLFNQNLPRLTKLEIHLSERNEDKEVPILPEFTPPPSLTHVKFDLTSYAPLSLPNLGSLASNATNLELIVEQATPEDLIMILEEAEEVEELVVREHWGRPIDELPEESIELPRLKSWKYSSGSPVLISLLSCPVLKTLEVSGSRSEEVSFQKVFPFPDNLPNLQNLVSADDRCSGRLASVFTMVDEWSIKSLDLSLPAGQLVSFCFKLREPNDEGSLPWSTLETLILKIDPDMLPRQGKAPADLLVKVLLEVRTRVTLHARISRECWSENLDGITRWIDRATTLGDRFHWSRR